MGAGGNAVERLYNDFGDAAAGIEVDGNTCAIVMTTEIVFAYDEAKLKKESFTFLDEFVPRYLDVLLESGYEEYVAEIIIEGHTDRSGNYLYNLELAQDRAYSVAAYVLSDDFPYRHIQEELEEKLTVNSKSYTDFRTDEVGDYSAAASRRVEFKFRLKDEEILNKTRELLGE